MNLETLISKLQENGRIKPSRLANIKMSARHFAQALGCSDLTDCLEEVFVTDKSTRRQKIEEHLKEKVSVHTLRNTKNDINFLLNEAAQLRLIKPIPHIQLLEEKKFGKRKISPYLPRLISHNETNFNKQSYSLPLEKWSEKLRQQYDEWLDWVTTERYKIQGIDSYNRPATIETKTKKMEAFFGFLTNIRGIFDLDLRMLMDVAAKDQEDFENKEFVSLRQQPNIGLLEEFIQWHRARYNGKISSQIKVVVSLSISIAGKFYLPRAIRENQSDQIRIYNAITSQIELLRASLNDEDEFPKPSLPKSNRVVSTKELWEVARQEFPHSGMLSKQQTGVIKATDAGRALAIMLMLEHPIRNKNLREIKLGQNLLRNSADKWILTFHKNEETNNVRYKKRRNNFDFRVREVSAEVSEYIDKYFALWHPKLLFQIEKQISEIGSLNLNDVKPEICILEGYKNYLFLNSKGEPFNTRTFSKWIERGVFRWLGVRTNPELIRQIASNK